MSLFSKKKIVDQKKEAPSCLLISLENPKSFTMIQPQPETNYTDNFNANLSKIEVLKTKSSKGDIELQPIGILYKVKLPEEKKGEEKK